MANFPRKITLVIKAALMIVTKKEFDSEHGDMLFILLVILLIFVLLLQGVYTIFVS